MAGLYDASGAYRVTVVGQNDLPIGVYAPDGSLRVTQDAGRGLYAPNGSIRIGSSGKTFLTPAGALNGVLSGSLFILFEKTSGLGVEIINGGFLTASGTDGVTTQLSPNSFSTTASSSAATRTFLDLPVITPAGKTFRISARLVTPVSQAVTLFHRQGAGGGGTLNGSIPLTTGNLITMDITAATTQSNILFATNNPQAFTVDSISVREVLI